MISIIIPAYNEGDYIEETLQSVKEHHGTVPYEVIVVDGESTDSTVERCGTDVRVMRGPRHRARQMNLGADSARGDILWFLFSHVRVPLGALEAIESAIIEWGFDGGGFSNEFTRRNTIIKTVGRVLDLRFRDLDKNRNCTRFFGDNGIFVRANVFSRIGGFTEIPLFEDLDFSERLAREYLSIRITEPRLRVEPRRLEQNGILQTQVKWLFLQRLYRLGVEPEALVGSYSLWNGRRPDSGILEDK